MRSSILMAGVSAVCLIVGANQSFAGAAKTNCTTITPGTGTPNVCGVQVPTGSQQVDPPGNIVDPDTVFTSGLIDDVGSGSGNATSYSLFLGNPTFSNGFDGSQGIANSVIEFDGTFTATDNTIDPGGDFDQYFTISYNCGSSVQLFVDGNDVPLTPESESGCSGDPIDSGVVTLPLDSVNTFVLDYYTGVGDPNDVFGYFLNCELNGVTCSDSDPGGTVPEPASMSLFAAALAGWGLTRRRRKRG